MSDPLPLTALSRRNVARVTLQRGPGYPEVISDREIGGPNDATDRRLILDIPTLQHLIDVARTSISQRVTLHHFGVRVQLLRDADSGHVWEHLTLIGTEPKPERSDLFKGDL